MELLLQEYLNIWRVDLCGLFGEADGREEISGVDLKVVVEDDERAVLLQRPDLLVELGILDRKQLLVHRVIGEQGHVVAWGLDNARGAQLNLDTIGLPLEILEVLFLECLVLEEFVRLIKVATDAFLHRVEHLIIDVALQDIGVHLFNKFHEAAQHSLLNRVGVRVRLDLREHGIVSLPVVLERNIVFNDQIDDVEIGQHGSQVVEHGVVHLLLEVLLVQRILVVKETVHLQQAVLGEKHDLLEAIEEGVQDGQDSRSLDLNLACLLLKWSRVF